MTKLKVALGTAAAILCIILASCGSGASGSGTQPSTSSSTHGGWG